METRYKRSKRRWLLLTIFPRDAVQEVRLKKPFSRPCFGFILRLGRALA